MTLTQLSIRTVLRSARSYRLWFLSVAVSATAFYLFQAAGAEPALAEVLGSRNSLKAGMAVASGILALFAGVFMAYSAGFFVRGRAREIGLYRLFGVGLPRIALMFLVENGLSGLAALGLGLGAGLLLSKLFFMALVRILDLDVVVGFSIDPSALLTTGLTFALLILVASVAAATTLFHTRLVTVFQKERTPQKAWKADPWLGLVSVPLLAAAYLWAGATELKNLVTNFLWISGLTLVGTWAFARGAAGLAVGLLRQNHGWFLRGHRMVALSHVAQRVGSNAQVFFLIAMVSSVSIITLGVGVSLKVFLETSMDRLMPHELSLSSAKEAWRTEVLADLTAAGCQATPVASLRFLAADRLLRTETDGDARLLEATQFQLASARDYLAAAEATGRAPSEVRRLAEALAPGEAFEVQPGEEGTVDFRGRTLGFNLMGERTDDILLTVKGRLETQAVNGGPTLVLRDDDWDRLFARRPFALRTQVDYTLSNPRAAVPILEVAHQRQVSVEARALNLRIIYGYNLYLFIGSFLGLVFLVCGCSVLHFKQLMDAREDRSRFETLRRIGMDAQQERRTAILQVVPVFGIPLLLACVHGSVALATMGRVLNLEVAGPVALVVLGFVVVFTTFGALTTRSYLKVVRDVYGR